MYESFVKILYKVKEACQIFRRHTVLKGHLKAHKFFHGLSFVIFIYLINTHYRKLEI